MNLQRPAKSMRRALLAVAVVIGVGVIGPATGRSMQLIDGMTGFKAYRIEFAGRAIGRLVVVACDNPSPPPGYSAGQEYWTWRPGTAWRGTFTLVPVDAVPDFSAHRWTTFPHEHFDLSHTVPMPAISPDGSDGFYRVQVRRDGEWIHQGWMWLINGPTRRQEWFGMNLTSDLVGDGTAIRFTSVEPPAPGSRDVYLLIRNGESQ